MTDPSDLPDCASCGHTAWTHGDQTGKPPTGAPCHAATTPAGDLECWCPGGYFPEVLLELAHYVARGETGDPAAARRAAELFELVDDLGQARLWWERAAELGDPDAIAYRSTIVRGL